MTIRTRHITATCAGLLVTATLLGGCRGERSNEPPRQFLPDMDDSPKWKSQSESSFFADGRTMRPEVEGAVPWGRSQMSPEQAAGTQLAGMLTTEREALLGEDRTVEAGVTDGGAWTRRVPVEVDREFLELGQLKYNIYCAVCHGMLGDGDGMVGQRWGTILPNFHDPKYKDPAEYTGADGYIFDVALHGVWDSVEITPGGVTHSGNQRMPGYNHALTKREAWSVVAYIRALQASRTTDLANVPEGERERLRGAKPPAPEPATEEETPADDGGANANSEEAGG